MEYVYAAMLLHKAGQKVDETSMKKVLEAASVKADASRIKALVAALESVDIDEAIKSAAVAPTAVPVATTTESASTDEKKEKKEEKKSEPAPEQAAAGLGSLFG